MQLCERQAHTWVVLASPSMNSESPGGAVLLIGTCRAGDTRCLQKETPHPLSDFRVYPFPDPTVVNTEGSGGYVNDMLWGMSDARCGGVVFDFETDHFYANSEAVVKLLEGYPARVLPPLSAPSFPANKSPLPKAVSQLPAWCKAG